MYVSNARKLELRTEIVCPNLRALSTASAAAEVKSPSEAGNVLEMTTRHHRKKEHQTSIVTKFKLYLHTLPLSRRHFLPQTQRGHRICPSTAFCSGHSRGLSARLEPRGQDLPVTCAPA